MTQGARDGVELPHFVDLSVLLAVAFVLLVVGRLGLPLLEPEETYSAVVPRDLLPGTPKISVR